MPVRRPAPRRALLLGAYGQSNLGDDLLLEAFLDLLAEVGITEVDVNVAEPDAVPAAVLAGRPGVRLFSTYRTPPWQMLRLLRRADLVCYGGGTVFKELNSSTGRSRYAVLLGVAAWNTIARVLRTPVHGWASRAARCARGSGAASPAGRSVAPPTPPSATASRSTRRSRSASDRRRCRWVSTGCSACPAPRPHRPAGTAAGGRWSA